MAYQYRVALLTEDEYMMPYDDAIKLYESISTPKEVREKLKSTS